MFFESATQPYQINPECKLRVVPLEPREKRVIRRKNWLHFLPITLLCLIIFIMFFRFGIDSFWNLLLIPILVLVFISSVHRLYKEDQTKDIFESELTNYFEAPFPFSSELTFKDCIGSSYWMKRFANKKVALRVDRKYLVHKVSGFNVIIRIEPLFEEVQSM